MARVFAPLGADLSCGSWRRFHAGLANADLEEVFLFTLPAPFLGMGAPNRAVPGDPQENILAAFKCYIYFAFAADAFAIAIAIAIAVAFGLALAFAFTSTFAIDADCTKQLAVRSRRTTMQNLFPFF
jgi:hypothetical protein